MAVIENKVSAATSGAGAAAIGANFVMWVLSRYVFHGATPTEIASVVTAVSAAGGAFVLGYLARHTHLTEVVGDVAQDVQQAAAVIQDVAVEAAVTPPA